MPSPYNTDIFSFDMQKSCVPFGYNNQYLITKDIGHFTVNYKKKNFQKLKCENKNFQIDKEQFQKIILLNK